MFSVALALAVSGCGLAPSELIAGSSAIIYGELDRATLVPRAQRMASAINGVRLAIIPEGGHLCTVEESAAVTAVLESFLEQQVHRSHLAVQEPVIERLFSG